MNCTTKLLNKKPFVKASGFLHTLAQLAAARYDGAMNESAYTLIEGGITVVGPSVMLGNEGELFLDATAVRRSADQEIRENKTRRILEILDETGIGGLRDPSRGGDRKLAIDIGFERRGYGVFGMEAEIAWPDMSDEEASRIATQAMRQMAHDLGTYSDKKMPLFVYAQVSRTQGMTFETNPAGSCSMDTDGSEYAYQLSQGNAERVALHAHNLYTHEMQLICISGLIGLAATR